MKRIEPNPETRLAAQLARETHANESHVITGRMFTAYVCARDATELCALARRATRLAVKACNGEGTWCVDPQTYDRGYWSWTEQDEAKNEKALERIAKRIGEIVTPYGAKLLTVHGDPRGCVVRIQLASDATNGIGEGWGL